MHISIENTLDSTYLPASRYEAGLEGSPKYFQGSRAILLTPESPKTTHRHPSPMNPKIPHYQMPVTRAIKSLVTTPRKPIKSHTLQRPSTYTYSNWVTEAPRPRRGQALCPQPLLGRETAGARARDSDQRPRAVPLNHTLPRLPSHPAGSQPLSPSRRLLEHELRLATGILVPPLTQPGVRGEGTGVGRTRSVAGVQAEDKQVEGENIEKHAEPEIKKVAWDTPNQEKDGKSEKLVDVSEQASLQSKVAISEQGTGEKQETDQAILERVFQSSQKWNKQREIMRQKKKGDQELQGKRPGTAGQVDDNQHNKEAKLNRQAFRPFSANCIDLDRGGKATILIGAKEEKKPKLRRLRNEIEDPAFHVGTGKSLNNSRFPKGSLAVPWVSWHQNHYAAGVVNRKREFLCEITPWLPWKDIANKHIVAYGYPAKLY
mmetsp:Transcript_4379/g.5885  ORF Transcript_4379/g.5885 Transcript_4379/m.5885 type:complete len:431 (+) Transcript_4379:60-1352(+)